MTEERRDNSAICERLKGIETALSMHVEKDDNFLEKYGALIDLLLTRETESARLRRVVIERLITGGIWAFVVFLSLSAWEFLKRNIK